LSLAAGAGVFFVPLVPSTRAESLADAIALAYQSNPTLQSARAQLRALDEDYVQARAGFRATATLQAGPAYSSTRQPVPGVGTLVSNTNAGALSLQLSQPIYTGGRVSDAVDAASLDVAAGREGLRVTEAQVILSVVQAYEDVRRDEQILKVYADQVDVLQSQLDEAKARRAVAVNTRTDVEQSQTQLESARAQRLLAEAQLRVSRSNYVAAVGQNPGSLAVEPGLPGLPADSDHAFDDAEAESPVLGRAKETEAASRRRIAEARAAGMPSAALTASLGYSGPINPLDANRYAQSLSAGLQITQPILTGGLVASGVRQAIELNNSDRIGIEAARRAVIQSVAQAYNLALANRRAAEADARAAEVAQRYFLDTQTEYKAGQRSTLDVIVAQETWRDAEIARLDAVHDAYVAEASLLAAMGRLEARRLVADISLYEPAKAFQAVANKGWEPLEAVASVLDRAAPGAGRVQSLPAPAADLKPSSIEGAPIPPDAPFSRFDPTVPLPGSVSPMTPSRVGEP